MSRTATATVHAANEWARATGQYDAYDDDDQRLFAYLVDAVATYSVRTLQRTEHTLQAIAENLELEEETR